MGFPLTRSQVLVREISAVLWAWPEDAPECSARVPSSETGNIKITGEWAILERLLPFIVVNLDPGFAADQNWEIDMAIYVAKLMVNNGLLGSAGPY